MQQSVFLVGLVAALTLPAATLAQTEVVLRCDPTGGSMAPGFADAIYRFNASAQWHRWSPEDGAWADMCEAPVSCSVTPARYTANWSPRGSPISLVEWSLDRSNGRLIINSYTRSDIYTTYATCAPTDAPAAPRPTF